MSKQIAQTILDQIKAIDKMAIWAWGSSKFTVVENGLKFTVQNNLNFRAKHFVVIELNEGTDMYEVKLFDTKANLKANEKDVFCDELVDVIDGILG